MDTGTYIGAIHFTHPTRRQARRQEDKKTQTHSHAATQPHSHTATPPQTHTATPPPRFSMRCDVMRCDVMLLDRRCDVMRCDVTASIFSPTRTSGQRTCRQQCVGDDTGYPSRCPCCRHCSRFCHCCRRCCHRRCPRCPRDCCTWVSRGALAHLGPGWKRWLLGLGTMQGRWQEY